MASLIDWPSQTRVIEFLRHAHGQLEIACTLMDHRAAPGSLAYLHHAQARLHAGDASPSMQGSAKDGNVRQMRDVPR